MADEMVKEILGLTKESLFIFGGIILILVGLFLIQVSRILGDLVGAIGLILAIIGLVRDFKKKNFRIGHIIGNILVIIFLLALVGIYIMMNTMSSPTPIQI